MYGMLTKIVVKPGKRTELLEYLRRDVEVAKAREPGTRRFDVWRPSRNPAWRQGTTHLGSLQANNRARKAG